jgi:hydroxymethylpyrimidine/phosphomethylpyrimidine kinase
LSAAIAAGLGKGMTLEASIAKAKRYVLEKLAQTQRSPAN